MFSRALVTDPQHAQHLKPKEKQKTSTAEATELKVTMFKI